MFALILLLCLALVSSFSLPKTFLSSSLTRRGLQLDPKLSCNNLIHAFLLVTPVNAVKIILSEDEPIESVLKRFKRGVNQSGHLFELRFKEKWENAHDKRKRKV